MAVSRLGLGCQLPQGLEKQCPGIHAPADLLPEGDSDPHGQQRVSAEIEKVVSGTDLVDSQRLAPDSAKRCSIPGAGGSLAATSSLADRKGSGSAPRSSLPFAVNGRACSVMTNDGIM